LHRSFNPAEVLQNFIEASDVFYEISCSTEIINNFHWVSESEFFSSAGNLHRGFNPAEVQQVFVEANDGFYDFPCPIEDHK
jgi:hypothetical protein